MRNADEGEWGIEAEESGVGSSNRGIGRDIKGVKAERNADVHGKKRVGE